MTNRRFIWFGSKQRENEGMEQFYGALSDLTRGAILVPRKDNSFGSCLYLT